MSELNSLLLLEAEQRIKITIHRRGAEASMRLLPPNSIENLTLEVIISYFNDIGIVNGINNSLISEILLKGLYFKEYVFARAKELKSGEDAYIKLLKLSKEPLFPFYNEDFSINLNNIPIMKSVKKNDKVMFIYPPSFGNKGMNIFGNIVDGVFGRSIYLESNSDFLVSGNNPSIVFAKRDGVSYVLDGKLALADGEIVTKDISYEYSIDESLFLKGDIEPGASTHFGGNLTMLGNILGGNTNISGFLNLNGNMQSNTSAKLNCHGDCSFVNSSGFTIVGGKTINVAGSLLYSKVTSRSSIIVEDSIEGGTIDAKNSISATNVGCGENGPKTIVEVGSDFKLSFMYQEMKSEFDEINTKFVKVETVLKSLDDESKKVSRLPYEKEKIQKELSKSYDGFKKQISGLQKRMNKIKSKVEKTSDSFIHLKGKIQANTVLKIKNIAIEIKKETEGGLFKVSEGKIVRR